MFLRKIGVSITKIILPFFYKILKVLKTNTRAINFLNEKKLEQMITTIYKQVLKKYWGKKN